MQRAAAAAVDRHSTAPPATTVLDPSPGACQRYVLREEEEEEEESGEAFRNQENSGRGRGLGAGGNRRREPQARGCVALFCVATERTRSRRHLRSI